MPTPKELVQQAMSQSHPAAIPVMCQMANGHTIINTKVHLIDYFINDEIWAGCLLKMRELYDFDGILCHKPGRVQGLMDLVDRTDYDAEVPTLYLKDGSRIECTRDDDAYYKKAAAFAYPTLDTIDDFAAKTARNHYRQYYEDTTFPSLCDETHRRRRGDGRCHVIVRTAHVG